MPDNKEGYSNLEMLKNQANTIAHHAKEFKEAVDKSEDAMPWEVAKAMRASTDLSDITHYREGEADSYAKGGQMDFDIDDFDAPHELVSGGKLEVGRTYRAKDGNSYRYVGGDYFLDAQRNYVKKGRDEFEGYFFEEGGMVDADSVVPGARFKNPSGTVFIVDKVLLEKSSVTGEDTYFVHSSLEGGEKGNYRDPLDEFVAFMNEEKATPVMAGGGEAEEGGFYIYGKTQRDNYDIANMLRELEIQFEWEAAEGRFRIVEDDEYGDLAFRLQVEMDDRPVYGRIEKVIKWGGYAEHGMELEEEDDLFDKWEELPDEVHEVLEEYEKEEPNASNIEDMRGRLNALGYDFEYGLDYSPYGLRKMAEGGKVGLSKKLEGYYKKAKNYPFSAKKIKVIDENTFSFYNPSFKSKVVMSLEDNAVTIHEKYEDDNFTEDKKISLSDFEDYLMEEYKNGGKVETGAKPIMKGGGEISEDDFEKANKWWNGLKQDEIEQILNENKFQENETFEQWLVKVYERAHKVMPMRPSRYGFYAEGGPVKFKDKVAAVKKNLLKRKKVPKSVQKDYGKTYSPDEAQESAQRIVGAQTARERLMMRIKKGKKKK